MWYFFSLTLRENGGKIRKNERDDENQYALPFFSRELPFGARQ